MLLHVSAQILYMNLCTVEGSKRPPLEVTVTAAFDSKLPEQNARVRPITMGVRGLAEWGDPVGTAYGLDRYS